jgi:hypothetical protein
MTNRHDAAARYTAAALAGVALALAGAPAAAVTPVDPGDYTGLPGGTTLAALYYQHITAKDSYANGNKVVDHLDFKLDLGDLRVVHYMDWGTALVAVDAQMTFGKQDIGLLNQSVSGNGDLKLGMHYWPMRDLKNNEHLALSVFLVAPSGNKADQGFALSGNRWALNPGVGYIRNLAPDISLDLAAQLEFYGKDRDSRAKKNPATYIDTSLSYRLDAGSSLSVTYRHTWGGKEKLGGVTVADKLDNGTLVFGWQKFLAKQWQLSLRYRQDVKTEQGPKVRGLETRLLYLF